eukprot:gene10068-2238_t
MVIVIYKNEDELRSIIGDEEYLEVDAILLLDLETFLTLLDCLYFRAILDRDELIKLEWSTPIVLLLLGFALCLFLFTSLVPVLIKRSSATLFNLSLLTSDVYAMVLGTFVFGIKFSWPYIGAFFVILCGVLVYHKWSYASSTSQQRLFDDFHSERINQDSSSHIHHDESNNSIQTIGNTQTCNSILESSSSSPYDDDIDARRPLLTQ